MHHPFSYLAEWDGEEAEASLQHHFAVVLRGHLHKQKQEQRVSDPNRPILLVTAGSCYSGSKYPNAYQLMELRPDSGEARIHLRTWDGLKWIADRNAHEDGPTGVITRQLRSVPTRGGVCRGAAAQVAPATSRGSGSSPYIAGPPIERESNFVGRSVQIDQIRRYLDLKQSMQLIGEHRMGRTSMLRWIEREARRQKLRVAALDAAGLSGRSPGALVVAIAEALGDGGFSAEARRINRNDARQAEALLPALVPSLVLIDNADELARSGHGFDKAFFDTWRSLGSEGLIWISTSRRCLFELFMVTGLTSSFLNDARKVWLGQLEREEALELARRGLESRLAEPAVSEAARFPYLLQWLCEALWREPGRFQKAIDRFRNEMEPIM
jgi:hypothetical protein